MPRPRTGSLERHGDHFDLRVTLNDGSRSRPIHLPPGLSLERAREIGRRESERAARGEIVRENGAPAVPVVTVADVVDRWLPLIKSSDLAPATRDAHAEHAKGSRRRFGDLTPDALTTPLLRAWLRELKGRLSASRTRNVFFSFSKMLDDAMAEAWISLPLNPCRHKHVRDEIPPLEIPHDDDKARHTEADASKLIRATTTPERRLRYLVAFTSGMRDGEIAGLRWADVVNEHGVDVFHVRGAVAKIPTKDAEGRATRQKTKTPAGRRKIPIHPTVLAPLEAWREAGWATFVGRKPTDDDPIFPASDGAPDRPRSAEFFRVDLEAAGLPSTFDARPFDFRSTRRSFATWLEAHGATGETVDRLLGHAALSVRRRHYSAGDLDVMARAIRSIRLDVEGKHGPASSSSGGGSDTSQKRRTVSSDESAARPRNEHLGSPSERADDPTTIGNPPTEQNSEQYRDFQNRCGAANTVLGRFDSCALPPLLCAELSKRVRPRRGLAGARGFLLLPR